MSALDAAAARPDRAGRPWAAPLAVAGLIALPIVTALLCLSAGRYQVPAAHVFGILLNELLGLLGTIAADWLPASWSAVTWTPTERIVITTVRLPRVFMAGVAGAGLALSGAVLQGMFRNPLVGPQTIGAASGASLGGVVAILLFGFGLPVHLGAFAGAALALAAVLAVHRGDGVSPVLTLVLAGVVVGAFCSALVGFVTFIADPEVKLPGIVFWLLGSFAAASWPNLALLAVCTAIGGGVMLAMRWRVNVLSLGDEEARSLGVDPGRDRVILLAATCLAISAQVAVSGAIGWVGLVIPNLARMVVGADHRRLLPVSAVAGAAFLMAADTLARDLTAAEIPVGIVTAIVGTPVFAWLLRRHAKGQGA
ncbi:ABC transporter permease [Rhodoplanes elegans]|uniref:ABC transporter permease n=1 Tax=Rhodoplanes elegans TaxID=29408 RepID=A0A327KL56_9BRAD|nr:iron ABC transporter permease [Rhodoplanes elegans]MBK5959451.1 ABC transporter permease [Rhodoplanes elegans]RAI39499.1 ABC transporter permease [Rhodoplanes elegans]